MSAIRSKVPLSERFGLPAAVPRPDLREAAAWAIGALTVIYLGVNGGGYDTTVWAGVGAIAWWLVALVALVALDLMRSPSRLGWVALGALTGLAVWSAIGMSWSSSDERTLNEVARVTTYLGVLVLAIAMTRRNYAHALSGGIGTGIVAIAVIALLSRLRPSWFPASANETSALLPGARNRLAYPLDYWNALGALVALGIPLVLSAAAGARAAWRQALAAAALPALVLTLLLTFSRGGLLALAFGLLTYLMVIRRRLRALASVAVGGVGAAIVCLVALNDHDLRQGLDTALAHRQGTALLIVLIAVSAGVAAAQLALAGLMRHQLSPGFGHASVTIRPKLAVGTVLAVAVVAFLVFGGPHEISHAWASFKRPQIVQNATPSRLGSLSGNGRYQMWSTSIEAFRHRPLSGIGAGTWEFWWARHGKDAGYAVNAHSLLFETLADTGIPGGVLVVVFLATVITATVRRAWRAAGNNQASLAAVAGACAAGTVSLLTDWSWQVAVVPVSMFALAGMALASRDVPTLTGRPSWTVMATRLGIVAGAAASLVSIAIPLAMTSEIRQSQTAFGHGAVVEAIRDARSAASLEPYAATPLLQQALVLESAGHLAGAEAAARRAEHNESSNWREPLILARIQAERGETQASLASAQRALTLNPSIRTYLP